MTLQGCAQRQIETAPAVIAVEVKDTPQADLLACPAPPAPFPRDATATIPPAVRSALIAFATAYADTRDQLLRVIRWHEPGACADLRR
ncbi:MULTISPECIES: hypothetical protein [unclassified Sphingobium]|uniref:hypothetical protein n=1 Tax=unclassified Sphingobium TaxID=2611147 RepID=UPI002224D257|nr:MULTISPECIES: hypothetical protein [unclassified Sphingobium]MCW2410879.1 hypothetical protein [Sphingobium sp. B8D3D]MCW2416831.1 hypothetical protein [Sphingobium sp. B8D3A]